MLIEIEKASLTPGVGGGTFPVKGNDSSGAMFVELAAETTKVLGTVNLAAGENHLGEVGGNLITKTHEYTRTAGGDTNQYIAGDVISDSVTASTLGVLTNIFRVAGGNGYITKIKISTDKKSITPRFRIHFFNASNPTVSADNYPFKEVYADVAKGIGYYDMPAMVTAIDTTNSDMSRSFDKDVRLEVDAASGSRNLYYLYETLDGFTPASGQKFSLTVSLDNN